MISTSDITGIIRDVTGLLPDMAVVQRGASPTSDGAGGTTSTLTTIATVPCLLTTYRDMADETLNAERVNSVVRWMVTLPAGTDVTARDRIVIGSRTFQVVGRLDGSYQTETRLICAEANP